MTRYSPSRIPALVSLFVALGLWMLALLPVASAAASPSGPCHCWCGKEGEGAAIIGEEPDGDACTTKCVSQKKEFLMCQNEGDPSPAGDLQCWEPAECAASGKHPVPGKPYDCLPGFQYCISGDVPMHLGLPIGDVGVVVNLGDYIARMYQFLIGSGAVFAMVMFIIGGVQYMLTAGSGGARQGTDRMKNAVIGFVLLLASYLILQTVNPQTLKLQLPQLPTLRPVLLPGDGVSCLQFYEQGYTVKTDGKEYKKGTADISSPHGFACPTKGELLKNPADAEVPDTPACYWDRCNLGKICRLNPDKPSSKNKCSDCWEVVEEEGFSPKPSEGVCQSMTLSAELLNPGEKFACVYSRGYLNQVRPPGCSYVELNCNSISKCQDYGNVLVRGVDAANGSGTLGTAMDRDGILAGSESLIYRYCKVDDPCGVGPCRVQTAASVATCRPE